MRHFRIPMLTLGMVVISAITVVGQEPAAKLPADGSWIRYRNMIKTESDGRVSEYTLQTTHSLVGTVVEDGATCRWVEAKLVTLNDGKEQVHILKALISEKDLLESELPHINFKRAWGKNPNGNVNALKNPLDPAISCGVAFAFPGFWKNSENIDAGKIIDYQKGQLKLTRARTRKLNIDLPLRANHNRKMEVEITAWFDEATAPFMVAEKKHNKTYFDGKLGISNESESVVEDDGFDAKSELPEQN